MLMYIHKPPVLMLMYKSKTPVLMLMHIHKQTVLMLMCNCKNPALMLMCKHKNLALMLMCKRDFSPAGQATVHSHSLGLTDGQHQRGGSLAGWRVRGQLQGLRWPHPTARLCEWKLPAYFDK